MDETGQALVECVNKMVEEFKEKFRELETYALILSNPGAFEEDLAKFSIDLERAETTLEELSKLVDRETAVIGRAQMLCERFSKVRNRISTLERFLAKVRPDKLSTSELFLTLTI